MSLVVSDTGPIHYLVLADLADVLPRLFSTVFIPGAVQRELAHLSAPTRVRLWLASAPDWLQVRDAGTSPQSSSTGAGEQAAIALALEISADALLADDQRARAEATARGLRVIGTLGLIELAAMRRLLDFETAVARLLATNIFLTATLIEQSRSRVAAQLSRTH